MGNSEVGHLNIGAGRIVYQDLEKINKAIEENMLEKNPLLVSAFEKVKKYNSTLHIKGLISPGGVHSHANHLYSLINLAKKRECLEFSFIAFTDGRDTPPKSAEKYISELENVCKNSVSLASLPFPADITPWTGIIIGSELNALITPLPKGKGKIRFGFRSDKGKL